LAINFKNGALRRCYLRIAGIVAAMSGRWVISNRFFPIQWNYRYFLSLLVCYGITCWMQTRVIFGNISWGWSFLLRSLFALFFLIFAWFTLYRESRNIVTSSVQPLKKKIIR
jgi:hypothetical protein